MVATDRIKHAIVTLSEFMTVLLCLLMLGPVVLFYWVTKPFRRGDGTY